MKPTGQVQPLFDIGFITEHFGTTNLGHYIEIIRSTSPDALRQFRAQIVEHRKGRVLRAAFADVPGVSAHDALIKAVGYELLRRSPWFAPWRRVFPLRRRLASLLRGVDLKLDDHFGALPVQRARRKNVLHMPVRESLASLRDFCAEHWKFLLTTAVTIALAVWLGK